MTWKRSRQMVCRRRPYWRDGSASYYDPFAVDPVRRSALAVAVSALIVFGTPALFGDRIAWLVLLAGGWFALVVLIFSIPVLLLSLAGEVWGWVSRRRNPSIDQLDLSPRVASLMRRHGYASIARIDEASDATLLLLSNVDARAVREVRRAINLWKYRRWQEAGFPSEGAP